MYRNHVFFLTVTLSYVLVVGACGGDDPPADTTGDTTGDSATDPIDRGADLGNDSVETDLEEDAEPGCFPGTGRCNNDNTIAYLCNDDQEWETIECTEDEVCWAGACSLANVCDPDEVTACVGYTRYEGCNPVGTGYGEFQVPFNLTCQEGEDGAELIPRLCLEGQTECEGDQVLLACSESGLEYVFATNCFEDDETTLCDDGQCITLCQYIEKRDTYVGCEYWAVDMDNAFVQAGAGIYYDAYHATFAVAVSNPGETLTAEIKIESRDEVLIEGTVAPGQMHVFQLPHSEIEGTMHGFWGYRITSTVPIVAYQFNPLDDEQVFSNDASLLLPTSSLGTEYYVMTRRQTFETLKGTLTIVATQEGETFIEMIRLPPRTDLNPLVTLSGSDIPPMEGGEELQWTLQQYEVLNIETNHVGADLTGTYIQSDRPIAVFGGSEAANAPNDDSCIYRVNQEDWVCEYDRETPCWDSQREEPNIGFCADFITCCADHIEQQMLPIFAWGREYNAVRSAPRGDEADVWRIMAGARGTQVTLVGIPDDVDEPIRRNYTIDEGEWFEFESRADFEILATGPIMVGQFLAAEQAPEPWAEPHPPEYPEDAGTGDPAFMLAVPREQYREDYIFLVPGEYESNWVTIAVPTGTDVEHEDEEGTEVLTADMFTPFATGEYSALRYQLVHEGYHRLSAELVFGVMVHGYDQYVSYGYPAGLDVKKINRRRE